MFAQPLRSDRSPEKSQPLRTISDIKMCEGRRGERISDRLHMTEREISKLHLGPFTAEGSPGLTFLESLSPGHSLTQESLIIIARICSIISGVRLPRDFTRRRDLVIKWFNDHLEMIQPVGRLLKLEVELIPPRDSGDDPA